MKMLVFYNSENLLFKDFSNIHDKNIIIIDYFIAISINNKLIKIIRKFFFNSKINNIVKIPFKRMWYSLNYFKWEIDEQYIVFFCGVFDKYIRPEYLLSLKKQFNIKYAIMLFDAFASPHSEAARYYIDRIPFEYILTFDQTDAKNHNYYYCGTFYSMLQLNIGLEQEYDLYYVGRNEPDRLLILGDMCTLMNRYNVSSKLRLRGVPSHEQIHRERVIYNQFIKYDFVLKETIKCNCILEMLLDVQTAPTQRYYEAVCYNKKLLTNNKKAISLPFYNPDYIHVFEKPEDIDWDWVKERIPVDYHYDGRFSPTHLIDRIIELEEEKESRQNAEKEIS